MKTRQYDKNYVQSILSFNILRKMEEQRVTVYALADACEVTPTSIKQLIASEQFISSRVLAAICNYLDTTPAELFKERENAETEILT